MSRNYLACDNPEFPLSEIVDGHRGEWGKENKTSQGERKLLMSLGVANNQISVTGSDVQTAHFDVTLASTRGFRETADELGNPAYLIGKGLAARSLRAAFLDCTGSKDDIPSFSHTRSAEARVSELSHENVALQSASIASCFENKAGSHSSSSYIRTSRHNFYCAASKLLILEDQLFDLDGGGAFAHKFAITARRAGRTTGLICSNVSTVFHNRQKIFDNLWPNLDFVVGEPQAVLLLFGPKRLDTLIPSVIRSKIGLIVHRVGYPSIFVRPASGIIETSDVPISREGFWSEFVPTCFDRFIASPTGTG